ncbi:hypothetical protein HPHPH6_1409 [Helicobacter pylori Hp H-6]|uniref:Uncharacterized protein n=1 Tax=Helicobacter pylori Hp H-6 TaxID=992061 RepID=J0N3E2_HELPX|nr:hypothetical protein HPHPH6_1409 [Helicobacter pylori Hp H-6]
MYGIPIHYHSPYLKPPTYKTLETKAPREKSNKAKNSVTALTTTKTETSALRICSLMGNITLESSSLANLYCMSHLSIVSCCPHLNLIHLIKRIFNFIQNSLN